MELSIMGSGDSGPWVCDRLLEASRIAIALSLCNTIMMITDLSARKNEAIREGAWVCEYIPFRARIDSTSGILA